MKLRVLLVEDSPIMSTLLRELVQTNGAAVVGHSETAQEAIAAIDLLGPDVVVIDIGLREGNGFDVLQALRRRPVAQQPTSIVLTNYAIGSYRNAAKRMGAGYFFDKSDEIFEMVRLVRQLVRAQKRASAAPD